MSNKAVIVPEGTFRSKLVCIIKTLCLAAAVCGLVSVIGLLFPNAVQNVVSKPYMGSVTARRFLTTWRFIHISLMFVSTFSAAMMGMALILVTRGKVNRGADLVTRSTGWLSMAQTASAVFAIAVFIYRVVWYTVEVVKYHHLSGTTDVTYSFFPLFSSFLLEALMVAQAVFIFRMLRRFLSDLGDTAASISRTIASGILRAPTIPGFTSVGFLIIGLVNFYLVIDRITVFSQVPSLSAAASVGLFALGGIADILLFFYLRKYKNAAEYLLYKGTPVEEA